jgi:hypothetical protein
VQNNLKSMKLIMLEHCNFSQPLVGSIPLDISMGKKKELIAQGRILWACSKCYGSQRMGENASWQQD